MSQQSSDKKDALKKAIGGILLKIVNRHEPYYTNEGYTRWGFIQGEINDEIEKTFPSSKATIWNQPGNIVDTPVSARGDIDREFLVAVREFVSYGICRQGNQKERDMLARRFAELAEKYEPLLSSRGMAPSQMSQVEFDEQFDIKQP